MSSSATKTETIDTETGEIISAPAIVPGDASMVTVLARAELDTTISTAKAYPRSLKTVMGNILSLATLDEQTAAENLYAISRGGKQIRGGSIRLAEIIQQCWGNCRVDARVIQIDRGNKVSSPKERSMISKPTRRRERSCSAASPTSAAGSTTTI